MNPFALLFTILIGFYSITLILIFWGLFRLKKGNVKEQPSVSVIIAARNEEENLPDCLKALSCQSYPEEKFEIIVANDRSTDNSMDILKKFGEGKSNFKVIEIKKRHPQIAPKKWALDQSIRQAKGEIILTTDADCAPSERWIESMITFFKKDVGLVAGFSPLTRGKKPNSFNALVVLESMALAGVAAGSTGLGFPLTCNGRNLAYRKKVFEEVGGFDAIAEFISGDDDLFMHQIRKRTKWKIRYATDRNAIVPSKPPTRFKDFVNQRLRHASKGKSYALGMKLGLTAVYLFNLGLILTAIIPETRGLFLRGFLIKFVLDFFILVKTSSLFGQKRWLISYPIAAVLHPVYVVVLGLWGQLGRFHWKGSTYKSIISS